MRSAALILTAVAALTACTDASAQAEVTSPAKTGSEAITPIGDLRRGTMVSVRGTVEKITDEDEFRLADESGNVRVYVGPNWVPADVGESITVRGFVDDAVSTHCSRC
jgi:uncharacterized protein YdeI (BOF family)